MMFDWLIDLYPDNTLKKFNESIQTFRLEAQYKAQYPDPLMDLMDATIQKWKSCSPEKKVDLDAYYEIRSSWISLDMVTKLLGLFSSQRMHDDWWAVPQNERNCQKASWEEFLQVM